MNNENKKIIGYDSQTGQPIYETQNDHTNDTKNNKNKTWIIVIGIIVGVILLIGGLFTYNIFKIFNAANNLKDNINDVIDEEKEEYEEEKEEKKNHENIAKDILSNGVLSKEMRLVSTKCEWDVISSNCNLGDYYYFIDNAKYDLYKHYWLEDIDNTTYYDGLNENLGQLGDYAFYVVNVTEISSTTDHDYGNVHLKKDKDYYLVEVYDKAIYYLYVEDLAEPFSEEKNLHINEVHRFDENNLIKQYICYYENEKLIKEELYK